MPLRVSSTGHVAPALARPDLPRPIERMRQHTLEHLDEAELECLQPLKSPTQRFLAATQHKKTLKLVAELAGVSYTTVSRAMNGRDRIAPTTSFSTC